MRNTNLLFTSLRFSIIPALLLSFIAQSTQAGPVFIGLGDLPGGSFFSRANAVSADGTTVVGASISNLGGEAIYWTFGGGMVGLGDLTGGIFTSQAFDVSADGLVIIGESQSSLGNEAFRWTAQSGMIGLGSFNSDHFFSTATSVSADGSVVGGGSRGENGFEAFRWTVETDLIGLGDLQGGVFASHAMDLSSDGSVIVGNSQTDNSDGEAFRWTEKTGMQGLGFLPGGGNVSDARTLTQDGNTIVGMSDTSLTEPAQAFLWTESGGMIPIGSFIPTAISDDGKLIVGSDFSNIGSAVIWDAFYGIRSLKELLEIDFGLDLDGWELISANDISADGTVIVGSGINPLGRPEGWVAVIPEPSSLVLLTILSLIVVRPRRTGG